MIDELGYPQWLDYLEHFLEIKPDAKNDELFKRFPELNGSQEILTAAYGHIMAVRDGVSRASIRVLFPEIYRPKKTWWQKFRTWMKRI